MKRLISWILCLTFFAGLCVVPASAEEETLTAPAFDGVSYSTLVSVKTAEPSPAMWSAVRAMLGSESNDAVRYILAVDLSTNGGLSWFAATEENMPEDGVFIRLPYPTGTSAEEHDFMAIWVNETDGWSLRVPEKDEAGLVLNIDRLDDICLTWKDAEEPEEGEQKEDPDEPKEEDPEEPGEEEQPVPWNVFDENTFTDVKSGAWYYDYVKYVYLEGLMLGVTDGEFGVGSGGTRAQVVTILYRLADEPAVSGASGFSDVRDGRWYSDAVTWAAKNGITAGYEDGTFRPHRAVTRQEFITMMLHMAQYLGIARTDDRWEDSCLEDFPDAGLVDDWARAAENWSVGVGFQTGSADDNGVLLLNPGKAVTRAELAAFLTRFCQNREEIRQKGEDHYSSAFSNSDFA